jgi:hypothetical protein
MLNHAEGTEDRPLSLEGTSEKAQFTRAGQTSPHERLKRRNGDIFGGVDEGGHTVSTK